MWKWRNAVFLALAIAVCLFCGLTGRTSATTGINQELSFEGKIVTAAGINIPDGTYNMEFNIYTGCSNEPTNSTGCTTTWTEDWLVHNTQAVTFTSGTFQANLGSICAFSGGSCGGNSNTAINWNTYPLYLSIEIGNTSNSGASSCAGTTNFNSNCGGDGVMNPYVLLTATPYALNAGLLGGIAAGGFVQLGATQSGNINIGTGTITSGAINSQTISSAAVFTGTVNIQGASALTVGSGSNNGAVIFTSSGGTNTVTLQAPTTNPTTAYALKLPTTAPALSQCLQNDGSTIGQLTFAACGGGGSTLQGDYTASTGSTTPEIILDTTRNGLDIQDKTGGTIGATQGLLNVRGVATASTLGASLFTVNASGQVSINNGGTTATPTISYDLSFGQGANRTIGVETQATAATAGNNLTISAGTGNTSGGGGTLNLQAGQATATAGSAGGTIAIGGSTSNGSSTGTGGAGGGITITAGNAGGSGGNNGGGITLQAGSATGAGVGGGITLTPDTAGAVLIGATAGTGNITLGSSSATESVLIGNGAGASTVNIANVSTAGNTVNIATSNAATADNINIGTGATTVAGGKTINIGNGTPTGSGTNLISIGSLTNASTTTLQGGTGGTAVSIQSGTSGSILVGTSGVANTIQVGNTTGGVTQAINIGNNSTGSSVNNVTVGSTIGGTVLLQGATVKQTITGGSDIVQSVTTNNAAAFQVQNSNGVPIFSVDTTTNNLLSNPGFEINTTGWGTSGAGTGLAIARNTTKANVYHGIASLQVTTASNSANTGATVTSFTTSITPGNYVLSFEAMGGATNGNFATLSVTTTGGGGAACALNSTTVSTTGFQQYTCTIAPSGSNLTAINFLSTDAATQHIFYIDSVQLVTSANNNNIYDLGNIMLRGVITNPAAFQSSSNSTTAFQIQSANGSNTLFTTDTINNKIILGTGTGSKVTLLVIGNKTDTGDPGTCTNGAIYYNSTAGNNEFRACRGGTWFNLIAGVDTQDYTATSTWTKPSGISVVIVAMCGGGGSGGGGQSGTASTARGGGTAGGGGAYTERVLNAADVGSSVTATVGAQTTGGSAGAAGTIGNASSFGSLVNAGSGGAGAAGGTTATSGGGGGGMYENGGNGGTSTSPGGENPFSAENGNGTGYSGGSDTTGNNGNGAELGGGAGGGNTGTGAATGNGGGDTTLGGSGGGGGGGTPAAGTTRAGGAGGGVARAGAHTIWQSGDGAAGGPAGGASPGTNGSAGNSSHCGGGGGGGGSINSGTGGAGGAGGNDGGGGGGGGVGTTGGAGGNGGRGEIWVFSW